MDLCASKVDGQGRLFTHLIGREILGSQKAAFVGMEVDDALRNRPSVKCSACGGQPSAPIAPLGTGGTPGRLYCVFALCGKFSCCKGSLTS